MPRKKRQDLAQNYVCPKCRGKHAEVREVAIAKSALFDLLPLKENRYLQVTCTLCGYIEFYNRALYLRDSEAQTARDEVPLREQANGS